VFHARVWDFDQLVAVLRKGYGPKYFWNACIIVFAWTNCVFAFSRLSGRQ